MAGKGGAGFSFKLMAPREAYAEPPQCQGHLTSPQGGERQETMQGELLCSHQGIPLGKGQHVDGGGV